MSDNFRQEFRATLAREPLRHLARLAQFQSRWAAPRRLARERALRAAVDARRSVVQTSGLLRPPPHHYQGYAGPWIEDYFLDHWLRDAPNTEVAYLPVFWTDIFLHAQTHRFTPGQRERFSAELGELYDRTLAGPRCYFTLVEYDHMIWDWHAFPRNVAVFSAGGWGDAPLPLLKGSPAWSCPTKDIRLSFVGRLDGASDTGSVRSRMHAALRDHALFTSGPHWREVMSRSTFSLCPRGLGRASFRFYEALSVGSIPIYVWDDREWLPYRDEIDWAEISISLNIADIAQLPGILASYDATRIAAMQRRMCALYENYFTLDGMSRQVVRRVQQLADHAAFRRLMEARPYPAGTVPVAMPKFLQAG